MVTFFAALVLLAIAMAAVVLRKTYYFVPPSELKRQAASGDTLASTLYQAVAYGNSLRTLLWLIIGLSSALGYVLLAHVAPSLLGFGLIGVVLWLTFSWLPNTRVTKLGARLAIWLTPAVTWLLNVFHPLLAYSTRLTNRYVGQHTGLFEREDLLALLDQQRRQPDSRFTTEELDIATKALTFDSYKIRDRFKPRASVKSVTASDAIGPVLLDELHLSGQSSFPVKKSARSETIIGSLQLKDVDIHSIGSVQDHMVDGVSFVQESDSLASALHLFYATKHQLFVVVNNFEEYLGIITLADILEQLVGPPPVTAPVQSEPEVEPAAAEEPIMIDQNVNAEPTAVPKIDESMVE